MVHGHESISLANQKYTSISFNTIFLFFEISFCVCFFRLAVFGSRKIFSGK